MEFFKIRNDIPFMRHALAFNVVSLLTFLLAVFFLATKGLNFSIEFTGGTVMEVSYEHAAEVEKIRKTLDARGYHDYSVQNFGSSRDVLIRMPLKPGQNSADLSKAVMEGLAADDRTATLRRVETNRLPSAPSRLDQKISSLPSWRTVMPASLTA